MPPNPSRPVSDPFSLSSVLAQAKNDLFGTKDVQDVITASYVWLADQIGHFALGLVPTLLVCWLISAFGLSPVSSAVLSIGGMLLIFSYWVHKEQNDIRDTRARAGDIFPFDSADIVWNVKTALLYFGIGGILAVAAFIHWWTIPVALAVLLYPAFRVALWWLRRKLAFQQAGLPYLFRLANFQAGFGGDLVGPISSLANLKNHKVAFWRVLFGKDPVPDAKPSIRHILVTGPLGAGKTSLAVGIGTEFAFALGVGRYLTAAKLVQVVTDTQDRGGELEKADGRLLWPWRNADLLIIDDVDAGATPSPGGPDGQAHHLIRPDAMARILESELGARPLAWLAEKRSVWIVGDASEAAVWRTAIASMMAIDEADIVAIDLKSGPPAAPSASAPIGGA